jgi:hypothetical protein
LLGTTGEIQGAGHNDKDKKKHAKGAEQPETEIHSAEGPMLHPGAHTRSPGTGDATTLKIRHALIFGRLD